MKPDIWITKILQIRDAMDSKLVGINDALEQLEATVSRMLRRIEVLEDRGTCDATLLSKICNRVGLLEMDRDSGLFEKKE